MTINHRALSINAFKARVLEETFNGDTTELVYKEVSPERGSKVIKSLEDNAEIERRRVCLNYNQLTQTLWFRVFPSELFRCHNDWIQQHLDAWIDSGAMQRKIKGSLHCYHQPYVKNFELPYESSFKSPELCVTPFGSRNPTIVLECGWTKSWKLLNDDLNLWFAGHMHVNAVILLKWSLKTPNQVKGVAEIYVRDHLGNLFQRQRVQIFPATKPADPIVLCRSEWFGQFLPDSYDPNEILPLSSEKLREEAREALWTMGMSPAVESKPTKDDLEAAASWDEILDFDT